MAQRKNLLVLKFFEDDDTDGDDDDDGVDDDGDNNDYDGDDDGKCQPLVEAALLSSLPLSLVQSEAPPATRWL